MVIFWPSLSEWENCKQQYLWRRGFPGIDLGNGMGKPMSRPKDSKTDDPAMIGTVVQKAIELFYLQRGWLWGEDQAVSWIGETAQEELERAFRSSVGPRPYWKLSPFFSYADAKTKILRSVRGYIRTCKENRLFGRDVRPEAQLKGRLQASPEVFVQGRLDLYLVRDEEEGPLVVDGKNGREFWDAGANSCRMHVDLDQLVFYALVVRLVTGKVPKKLGIVPYQYPYGYDWAEEKAKLRQDPALAQSESKQRALAFYENRPTSTGVVWYPCNEEMVLAMAARVLSHHQELVFRSQSLPTDMTGGKQNEFSLNYFPPDIKGVCNFCNYETVCPDRQAYLINLRSSRKETPVEDFVSTEQVVRDGDLDGLDFLLSG